jgi:hypothetical protein
MNRSPKAEAALRKKVEKILKLPVPDLLWNIALKENYVSEVLKGGRGANTPESFADRLRDWMAGSAYQERAPQFITPARRQRRGKTVQSHQESVSEAIAEIVRQKKEVQSFRSDVLNGQLLRPEEVEPWIEAHRKDATYWHAVIVRLKPDFKFDDRGELQLKPLLTSVEPDNIERFANVDSLDYAKPGSDWVHRVPIGRDGTLRVLHELSKDLATYFHWQEAQATVFVLTDLTPVIDTETISASPPPWVTLPYGGMEPLACLVRVTLKIDPMITPEELAKKYAVVRNRLLVKKPRALSEKHLALAVFAAKHPVLNRDAMEQWARESPQWSYQRVSLFVRDARTARSRLLHRSPVGVFGTLRRAKAQPRGDTEPRG